MAEEWAPLDDLGAALWSARDYPTANEAAAAAMRRSVRGQNMNGELSPQADKLLRDALLPHSLSDVALLALPGGKYGKAFAALAMSGLLDPTEAQAGPRKAVGEIGKAAADVLERVIKQAQNRSGITDPVRQAYPGIYKRPDILAAEAAANVAPESPWLKQLFGVTRDDLWEIGGRGTRAGNMEPEIAFKPNARGSYVADALMNEKNAQRLIDQLAEAGKYPELFKGMDSWFVMDPLFQRMRELVGREQAVREYPRFNAIVGMFSPGSTVPLELNRGTAANMMINRGEWDLFRRLGGLPAQNREADFPEILRDLNAHPYHRIPQTGLVDKYLQGGPGQMQSPKVPLYIQASGVPETGFQTRLPVGDAHWTRGVGAADVRRGKNYKQSMAMSEYQPTGPWYRDEVATPLGLEAVPAEGRQWGLMAKETRVGTPVGAPKLELLSDMIAKRAQKLGIDPKRLRDEILTGRAHASWLLGAPVGASVLERGQEQE